MADRPDFGKRRPQRLPDLQPEPAQKRSRHVALLVMGAFTDLVQPSTSVRIIDHTGTPWCNANSYVPLWAVAGRGAGQVNVQRWPIFYYLPAREYMQFAFQNAVAADGPESNGTVTLEALRLS